MYGKGVLALNVTAVEGLFDVDEDNHAIYFASTYRIFNNIEEPNSVIYQVDAKIMTINYSKQIQYIIDSSISTMAVKEKNQIVISVKSKNLINSYI